MLRRGARMRRVREGVKGGGGGTRRRHPTGPAAESNPSAQPCSHQQARRRRIRRRHCYRAPTSLGGQGRAATRRPGVTGRGPELPHGAAHPGGHHLLGPQRAPTRLPPSLQQLKCVAGGSPAFTRGVAVVDRAAAPQSLPRRAAYCGTPRGRAHADRLAAPPRRSE